MPLPPNTFLKKVHYKDDVVTMIFKSMDTSMGDIETTEKCHDKPTRDFIRALHNLEKAVRTILQLPDNYGYLRMSIGSVTWSYSEDTDVRGAVISATLGLDTSNSPFCFNTPHLPFSEYSEGSNQPIMPLECRELLDDLQRETILYKDGKRAQGDLFAQESGD